MNLFTKALTRLRRVTAKQVIVAGVFALAVVGAAGAGNALKPHASAAPDCGTNAIIRCGYSDPTDLVNKLNSNTEWRDVEAQLGHLAPSDYSRFISSAVPGEALKDGTVVVNGQVVATNAWSLGRHANSHYPQVQYTVDNDTFYASSDQSVFLGGSIPVYVLFNAQGQMQAAIMEPCGNPVTTFTPVTPSFNCDALYMAAVADKLNSYDFTSHVTFANGAVFDKVVYNFGDGSAPVSTLGTGDVIPHTYTKPGTWTATVSAYFTLPGGTVVATTPSGNCVRSVTVKPLILSCVYLQGMPAQDNRLSYTFTLKADAENGATLTSADFDFGDGNTMNGVKPGTGNNASIITTQPHVYAKAGNYTVTPTLHFTTPTGNQTVVGTGDCVAHISPTPPPQPCQPGGSPAPGSPQCQQPCSSPTSIPAAGSPECTPTPTPTPPSTLVNTGAGNVIGLFAGTSVLGTAVHFFFQKRRLGRASL